MAEAHDNRGVALIRLGRPAEALAAFEQASVLAPQLAAPHLNRAVALGLLGRNAQALQACERALALEPKQAAIHRNHGRLLFELGRPLAALESYDRALALEPSSAEGHLSRGTALRSVGRLAEACEAIARAVELAPGHALARFSLADCCLHLGRYAEGWQHYEVRRLLPGSVQRADLRAPRYTGAEDLGSRTVFVWWEQAIGDTIQFARYLPLLEARGARVVFSVPKRLHAFLAGLSPTLRLIGESDVPADYDLHAPLLSLPLAFGTAAATRPATVPYLAAQPRRIAQWRERLGTDGFRIGVAWMGAQRPGGHGRAFGLSDLAPVAAVPGVRLISLQQGAGLADPGSLPPGMRLEEPPGGFDDEGDAFVDTAAIMRCLDLVICCDTSIAHLAGALACPTWLALKFMPDWRWGPAAASCAWYPTLRLYRQTQRWQWQPVFAAMARDLLARTQG